MSAAPSSPKAASPKSPKAPRSPKSGSVAPSSPSPKSPSVSGAKRAAADGASAETQGSAKKSKAEVTEYALNFNKALDKEHEGKTFKEIIQLPPSALQGLAGRADSMLAAFKIKTIEDLAKWKFFRIARAIVAMSNVEEKGKRPPGSRANINKALDKEFEKQSFAQIAKQPVSAMQGLAEWADPVLKPLGAAKISQLGAWRFCLWAEALVELAAFESEDMASL